MDKSLRRTALANSALLTFTFASTTAQAFASGNTIFGVIGLLATVLTAKDAVTFYNVKTTETVQGEENGSKAN